MNIYTPTYLYIKQHSVTGKLYFGKTVKNPDKYMGSGKHWIRHIKKHGKEHVETLWYCLFYDKESCTEFALNFSEQQNIVESTDWLNLKLENGKDGGSPMFGKKHSEKSKEKMRKPKPFSDEHQKNLHCHKINHNKVKCPHCGKVGQERNMLRWHFDNCPTINPRPNYICLHCGVCCSSSATHNRYHGVKCKLRP